MKNSLNKRGFLQMSFPWLFAIIVGAFILFLAIYGVSKLITQEETIQSAKTSKEIGVLLNPLETGFEQAKSTSLIFPVNTRMYNGCKETGEFGKQLISVSQKSFNKWTETDLNVSFINKYIFSNRVVEAKEMLIFSKPFEFPFKVSDVIYITPSTDNYCFIDAPNDIEDEIDNLNQKNLLVEDCEDKEYINVCFGGKGDCDIDVNYGSNFVEKSGKIVYFNSDSLMYAAIFSDPIIYNCQIKRLMMRVSSLATIYKNKGDFISRTNCGSSADSELITLINTANTLSSSSELVSPGLLKTLEDLDRKNDINSLCRLW